jgi:hypothetical protein
MGGKPSSSGRRGHRLSGFAPYCIDGDLLRLHRQRGPEVVQRISPARRGRHAGRSCGGYRHHTQHWPLGHLDAPLYSWRVIGRRMTSAALEASDPALEHVPLSDLVARSPAIPVQATSRAPIGPAVGNLAQSNQPSALVLAGIHTLTLCNPDPWRPALRQAASGARPERATRRWHASYRQRAKRPDVLCQPDRRSEQIEAGFCVG